MNSTFRMDTDGSILRTNNQNLGSYCMNLGDMIGLYSDEAEGVAEKPQDVWTTDTGNYGFEDLSDSNEITETKKACLKCNKDFKTDNDLQPHICNANQTKNSNPMKVCYINLADSPDLDDENEVLNELTSVPRKIPINCQNNIKNTKSVRPKGGSKILDLCESDIPIIIDDVSYKETPEKNVSSKLINIRRGQNTETNVSINSEMYINRNVIIIDDDSTNNSEIVFVNETDNASIDDICVVRDNNTIDLTDELIDSDNVEDPRFTSPSLTNNNIKEKSSDVIINVPPQIDFDELSKILENVSTDLDLMLGVDVIENNNSDIVPMTSEKQNCVTNVDVEINVPNIHDRVELVSNRKENETNTLKMRNLHELDELSSIYLENSIGIEELHIIKETEINVESVDSEIVLGNGMDVEDSSATLENDYVSNVLDNYVEVPDSNVGRDFYDPKDMDLGSVILQNDMDMVDLADNNPSVEVENVLEDVNPKVILENVNFDPKTSENCLDVLDSNVIENNVRVTDPQSNLEIDLNFLHSKTVTRISNSMAVDDQNIVCEKGLDDIYPKVTVESKNNITDSNNVPIDYFTKDSEGDMQAMHAKVILDKSIQLEGLNSLDDESMLSINTNPKMETKTQSKKKILKTEILPKRIKNVSDLNLNMLTDFDITSAKPDLLLNPGTFEIPSNQNLCDLGKSVLEDVVYKKITKNKKTKSKFNSNKPVPKSQSAKKPITTNEEDKINQNILTDSMLDIITSNPQASTKEAEHIMEIVSNLEESIARDLFCRNVSTNTIDANFDNIDEDHVKSISSVELVKISMPPDERSRFRKFRNKKTQTDSRRVKPSPQIEEEMREAGLFVQIRPPSQLLAGPEFKRKFKHFCIICNSQYDRISRLQIHMRRHNKDLKFQCEFCDSKFVVQYELDRHHRIVHLGNKKKGKLDHDSGIRLSTNYPHKCNYCRMFFQTKSGLTEHMKKRHAKEMFLVEANKPVECDVCQKKIIKSLIADHKAKAHAPPIVILDQLPDLA